jgi:HD-GYP domain-containing protein (c-di-GMP phosphodiesterase class II)
VTGRPPTDHQPARTRLAEVVASLSLATDMATGQALEHAMRRSLLALWFGEELGLSIDVLRDVYYVALLGTVGCSVEGAVLARQARDELAILADATTVDFGSSPQAAAWVIRNFGRGEPPLRRIGRAIGGVLAGPREYQTVCRDVAVQIGSMLDIGPTIREAVSQCHERWDGRGGPRRLRGDAIALPTRLFHLAHDADTFQRLGGPDAAVAVVRRRLGTQYDPALAERFAVAVPGLLARLDETPAWETLLASEPAPERWLSSNELDRIFTVVASFADVRSPFTLGHSAAVGALAAAGARGLRLTEPDAHAIHRAGLLHDLGRVGVPAAVWNQTTALSDAERAQVHSHPALTELILARSGALGQLGALAGMHHERLDGSGYRGVPASFQPVAAQLLAAADAYRTKIEPRPHRPALRPAEAAAHLSDRVATGRFAREVVDAILGAAGHSSASVTAPYPARLSEREVEVLRLLVRGLSNREMAQRLVVSPKTIGHHVAHIYDKIDVSTRVGATLFALRHGLVDSSDARSPHGESK